uniref:DmxL5 n=1 Tax=Cryptosporiopsis sp. (strain 8999) TaxID=2572248 RepID=A0A4P8DJB8_CRYX8|nr:DmxL5 [Cryptosporiopsis sp. 8999]
MSNIISNLWRLPSEVSQQLIHSSRSVQIFFLALFYLTLVKILRFRAVRKLQSTYAPYIGDPYSMDYKTAHEIMKLTILYEFPFMNFFATQWALIKTYGIASGTKLLVQTRQLAAENKAAKRAEDTSAILSEFLIGSVDSERGLRALSKMNWLHRRYSSKISNDEMIHTLAMFVLEPMRWIERYEWRPMTELEKVAIFTYWKEIGNRMGIKNIPKTLHALEVWAEDFEIHHMVYADSNRACMDATLNMFLRNIPKPLRNFGRNVASSLLEERVRLAVGLPGPPWWVSRLTKSFFSVRAWLLRNCFLPRLHKLDILVPPGPDGRIQRDRYLFEPWYVKDTTWNTWSTWLRTGGRLRPSPKYKSAGYLPEELGPVEFEKASKEPVLKEAEDMKIYADKGGAAIVGCPFAFGGN